MIYGIGHDIAENSRIQLLLKRYGNKFVQRILTLDEIPVYTNSKTPVQYLAKRFAAKEALAKACGTGLRSPVTLLNIAVLNDDLGKPFFKLAPQLQDWMNNHQIGHLHLSLSDEHHYTSAFVVLELF